MQGLNDDMDQNYLADFLKQYAAIKRKVKWTSLGYEPYISGQRNRRASK